MEDETSLYYAHESDGESETLPLHLHRRHRKAGGGNRDITLDSSSSPSSHSSATSSSPDESDMKWALSSNALFFIGSALQTLIAVWDLFDLFHPDDDDDADDDEGGGGGSGGDGGDDDEDDDWEDMDTEDYIYWYVSSAGAFLFIVNALVDLAWTHASASYRPGEGRYGEDPKWDALSAITFGVGAVLEFTVAAFLTDDDDPLSYRTNMISMHIYLLSGLFALKGEDLVCSCPSLSKFLMVLGGILFIAGSCVDVVMSYLYNRDIESDLSDKTLAWGNLTSSILWLIDAVLYTAADCIVYSIPQRIRYQWSRRKQCRRMSLELPRVIETRGGDETKALNV